MSLTIFIILNSLSFSFAQSSLNDSAYNNKKNDTTKSIYLHLNFNYERPHLSTLAAVSVFTNSSNSYWESYPLEILDIDSLGYLVKVNVPLRILALKPKFSYKAVYKVRIHIGDGAVAAPGDERIVTNDVNTSGEIQLDIKSTPEFAEIYLIPNRIWLSSIKASNWQTNQSLLEPYLVDTGKTNTSIQIDETVFVVIFKLGDKYQIRTHYTKPKLVEPVQQVSADF